MGRQTSPPGSLTSPWWALIGRGSDLPFIIVLLGVLGGALAFGIVGIFLGPTLLAIGYTVVRDWTLAEPVTAAGVPDLDQE